MMQVGGRDPEELLRGLAGLISVQAFEVYGGLGQLNSAIQDLRGLGYCPAALDQMLESLLALLQNVSTLFGLGQ